MSKKSKRNSYGYDTSNNNSTSSVFIGGERCKQNEQAMNYKLYEVGGRIRDFYLGVESKDVDYSVVFENLQYFTGPTDALLWFAEELERLGYTVVKISPETFTIKALFPKNHQHTGPADFVIARKETSYIPNTRTPRVEMGSLMEDLLRRDFTVNAMARDEDGNIFDPFGGQEDLIKGVLRTPKDAVVSFNNDPLRIVRALRFSVTKGLGFSDEIVTAVNLFPSWKMAVVSSERIRGELTKMFKYDTKATLVVLVWLNRTNPALYNSIMSDFWLMPTTKK
jgi:poly(A) polymerase